jgi:hypothetical protein
MEIGKIPGVRRARIVTLNFQNEAIQMATHFYHRPGSFFSGLFLMAVVLAAASMLRAGGVPAVHPIAAETRLVAGRTAVVPFAVEGKAVADTALTCTSSDETVVRTVTGAEVLAGQALGFVRVEALKAGEATLNIGGASIVLHVKQAVVTPRVDAWPVRLVGPARGASVWGRIAVGVDMNVSDRPNGVKIAGLDLMVDEKIVSHRDVGVVAQPPLFHGVIELDADALKPGPIGVSARVVLSDGRTLVCEPFPLLVTRVKGEAVIAGECELSMANLFDAKEKAKPSQVGSDADASAGKMIVCPSQDPMWGFETEVKDAGMYQLMVVGRGEVAAGAYPSVGVKIKPGIESESASRLVDYRWHRVPVGRAFKLAAGKQKVGVCFLNDFYAAGFADRNLYLDRYELARVEGAGNAVAGAGDAMMAAGGDAMMAGKPGSGGEDAMIAMMVGGAAIDGSGSVATFDASRWLADSNATPPLIVAFNEVYEGLEVDGDQTITGFTHRSPDSTPAPRIDLLVNGQVVMSEVSPAPRFHLDASYFKAGVNTLQMRAQGATGSAQTQVHHVTVDPAILTGGKPLRYVYLHVGDDAVWSPNVRMARTHGWPKGHEIAEFAASAKAVVTVPDDLEGEYEVFVDSQAEGAKKAAVKLLLKMGETETEFAHGDAPGWLDEHRMGKVTFAKGPKQVVVSYDDTDGEKGKAKFELRALALREAKPVDTTPPIAELLHPRNGEVVWGEDVAVIRAADDQRLSFVDIVIDGQRQGLQADFYKQRGNAVLPLAVARLAPGEHTISVRAADEAGNVGSSKTATFRVADAEPAEPTRYRIAVALLNRFAYGPEVRELSDLLTMGEDAWLRNRLDRLITAPGELESLARATMYFPDPYNADHVMQRSLHQALLSDDPVRARFVFWLDNHFTTWIYKVEPQRKWAEHAAFMAIGPARFDELLLTSATSPAMLRYLDQRTSFANTLNENYAREVMELHTVGVHGGYSQADVTSLAHVLNGWLSNDEAPASGRGFPLMGDFDFDPTLNNGKPAKWFGVNLPQAAPRDRYDRVRRVIETLAAHPATSEFICRKLVEHYGAYPAPEPMVQRLAGVFNSTGGDLREVLIAMSRDKEFRVLMLRPRVATPMDYGMRLARVSGIDQPGNINDFLARSGQSLFNRITPDGYPQNDETYSDSNAMLQRWKLAHDIDWNLFTVAPRSLGWSKPNDPELWQQQVVDSYAIRLTGRLLGSASNKASLDLLAKTTGDNETRMRQLAPFIASLPEASTR